MNDLIAFYQSLLFHYYYYSSFNLGKLKPHCIYLYHKCNDCAFIPSDPKDNLLPARLLTSFSILELELGQNQRRSIADPRFNLNLTREP